MSSAIELVERNAENTLEIKARIPIWKMPSTIGNSYKQIMEHLEATGAKPAGMPYVRYLHLDWERLNNESKIASLLKMFTRKWNMLIGFPVAKY